MTPRWLRWAVPAAAAAFGLAPLHAQSTCPTLQQSTFVQAAMQEWYLRYQQMPAVAPASYDSAEAYLEAVKYKPLDHGFSYIALRATSDAFLSEGQTIAL